MCVKIKEKNGDETMKKSKRNKNFGRGTTAILVAMMLLIVAFSAIDISAYKTSNSKTTPDEPNEDEGCSECADHVEYPCMRPDKETLKRWIDSYNAAPKFSVEEKKLENLQSDSLDSSYSVLDHVDYIPGDRDQANCGNCWAWAGTGCMEIAHDVENGIFDRLSIQYLNSNYNGGSGAGYACCGGWLADVATFYTSGFAVPWSNTNANWQDWNTCCFNPPDCPAASSDTNVPPASITTIPNYDILSISEVTIVTQTVSESSAIANIKAILESDQGIFFGFFLADFDDFRAFWRGDGGEDETSLFGRFHLVPQLFSIIQ
ncbi:unnamed protein product, partial [marine sediment metagenome]